MLLDADKVRAQLRALGLPEDEVDTFMSNCQITGPQANDNWDRVYARLDKMLSDKGYIWSDEAKLVAKDMLGDDSKMSVFGKRFRPRFQTWRNKTGGLKMTKYGNRVKWSYEFTPGSLMAKVEKAIQSSSIFDIVREGNNGKHPQYHEAKKLLTDNGYVINRGIARRLDE